VLHLRYSEQTALFDGFAEVAGWRDFQLLDQPLKTVDATHPKKDWQHCTHNQSRTETTVSFLSFFLHRLPGH
jgi:hypothetical protein